jgi:hypothetical protein
MAQRNQDGLTGAGLTKNSNYPDALLCSSNTWSIGNANAITGMKLLGSSHQSQIQKLATVEWGVHSIFLPPKNGLAFITWTGMSIITISFGGSHMRKMLLMPFVGFSIG